MNLRRRSDALIWIDQELADNRIRLGKARSQLSGALADIARLEHERDGLLEQRTAETNRNPH